MKLKQYCNNFNEDWKMVPIRVSSFFMPSVHYYILVLATMYTVEFYFHQSAPKAYMHITQFPQVYITALGAYRHQYLHDLSVMRLWVLGPLCILVRSARAPMMHRFWQGLSIFAGSAVFHHRLQPIIIFWDVDFQRLFFSATIGNHRDGCLKTILIGYLFDCLILTIGKEQIFWVISLNLVWCADF